MKKQQFIIESYEGNSISFQTEDAFVNATEMCRAFGKFPNDFLRLPGTQAFISALSEETGVMRENLVSLIRGNFSDGTQQGTWLHPDLALECARWLSPKFAIWGNRVIRRILAGEVMLSKTPNSIPSLPNIEPHLKLMRRFRRYGVTPDTALQVANDILNAEAVQTRFEARSKANQTKPSRQLASASR